ncbi:MAG: RNA-binding protein [Thermofilum sp. ex4484_15]|nr:MAG: RNA-binding protein [Thermofilum sp. ex4484_15]
MLNSFNLIVSTMRNREDSCITELWYFLRELGAKSVEVSRTGLPGLIVASCDLDPFYVVRKLREIANEKPWEFRYILKVVPVESVVRSELNEIGEGALKLARRKIGPSEKYKVEVHLRATKLKRTEIIESIAPFLSNRVDLENPDKIIRVEVIGGLTGLSVIEPPDVVSIPKIRAKKGMG